MQYPDSAERSAEYLRLAVAAMARHPAPWNPITYAVWYAYVSGSCAALNAEIDAVSTAQGPITDALVRSLHARHLVDARTSAADNASNGLEGLLEQMESTAARTGNEVAAMGQTLAARASAITGREDAPALRHL